MLQRRTSYDLDFWYMASPVSLLFFLGKTVRATFNRFKDVVLPNTFILAWFAASENWIFIFALVGIWVVAIVAIAIVRYRRFRFRLSETGISVREGVLREQHIDLQFDRIRAVNLERGIVDRLLGLTGISFDTAGSGTAEATIPAVPLEFATSLRATIDERRKDSRDDGVDEGVDSAMPNSHSDEAAIVTYRWPQVVRIGISSGNLALAIPFLAGILGFTLQYTQQLWEDEGNGNRAVLFFDSIVTFHTQFMPDVNYWLMVILIVVEAMVLLLLGWLLIKVLSAFFKWHNFRLTPIEESIKSVAGLKTIHEVRLDIPKIQSVSVSQNLRSRWFSFFTINAFQSTSDERHRLTIPYSTEGMTTKLCRRLLPEAVNDLLFDPRSKKFLPISSAYFWVPFTKSGLIPAVIGTISALLLFRSVVGLAVLGWLIPVGVVRFLVWRKAGYMFNENAIIYRRGTLSYTMICMKYSKIQSVEVAKSFVQEWTHKASLTIKANTVQVTIPYLDLGRAQAFRDYILYAIESSNEEWQ